MAKQFDDKTAPTPALNFREQIVPAGSWKINVATAGTGDPLVFMHALGGSWQWWLPVMNALPRKYRFVAFDFPGAGKSSRLSHTPKPAEFITALDQLFQTIELSPNSQLIGHSLGAYVGLIYAITGDVRFRKVVAIAPNGVARLPTSPTLSYMLRCLSLLPLPSTLFSWTLTRSYRSLLPVDDKVVNLLQRDFARRDNRISMAYQLLQANKIPTLAQVIANNGYVHSQTKLPIKLIWGKHDHIFSHRCGKYLANDLLRGAELVLLEKSRHWPHFDEPARFQRELENFLN